MSKELLESVDCEGADDQGLPKYGVLDQFQQKVISRKLLVFIAATCLLIWSTLDPETWAMIAAMYIGGQSVIDVAKVWKGM
jgi:hypothetical protein